MKWYSAGILIALIAAVAATETTYSNKFNNVNIDQIVANKRLFQKHYDCIMEKTKVGCPAEAEELKRVLPDALATRCAKCSSVQKDKAKKALEAICMRRPEEFKQLLARFDPTGEHRIAYEQEFGKLKGNC